MGIKILNTLKFVMCCHYTYGFLVDSQIHQLYLKILHCYYLRLMIIVYADSSHAQRSFLLEYFQSTFALECSTGKSDSSSRHKFLFLFLVLTSSRLQLTRILISWVAIAHQSSQRLKMLLTEGTTEALTAEAKDASRKSSAIVGTLKPSWVSFMTLPLIVLN